MLHLSCVAIILALSTIVLCNPTGINPKKDEHHTVNIMERTCESMSPTGGPGHANPTEQTPAPYTIEVSKQNVGTGESLQITLKGKNEEDKFKGILVQARRIGTANDKVAIGKFIIGKSGDGQLINCAPGNENSLFFRSREAIHSFKIDWQAPDSWNEDDVHILATFVKSKAETWLNVSSEAFKITFA